MQRINLNLSSQKASGSYDRSAPLAETFAQIPNLRAQFRIDRIADLTLLDRAKFPVVSAIVARSLDGISVYNGKGPTLQHAIVGAVMEAVERQAATKVYLPTTIVGSADDIIDARELGASTDALPANMPYVEGYDIVAERFRFVPLEAVEMPWRDRRRLTTSTNGLAAGNSLVEAIYHALFELVERHLFSLAQAHGHVVPRLIIGKLTGSSSGPWVEAMIDDPVGRSVERPTGDPAVDAVCDRIDRTDLTLRLIAYEQPALPILMVATVTEQRGIAHRVHLGLGCSWSPAHAVLRAVTEAMQSRLADTSGGREDIGTPSSPARAGMGHASRTTRLPKGRWYFDAAIEAVALKSLPDRASEDVATDVCSLLTALQSSSISRVVVVDITPPQCPISVVRIIAPDIESGFADGRVGPAIARLLTSV